MDEARHAGRGWGSVGGMAGSGAGASFELAGYDVEELLGSGATGEVWRAREHATDDAVALKRVHGGAGVEARDRLRREAAVLAVLDHPHVLRLRRLLAPGDDLVLVLDHAVGGSLARLLATRGRLTAGECVTLGVPLAQALAAVHARGLLHGDLSPGNVLFTGDGRPLLADLGLARVLGYDAGDLGGSRGFLDPSLRHGPDAGPSTDVHGLGAVLHAALAGQAPYDDQGLRGLALAALVPGAPPALVAAIEAALAADAGERPGAGELAAALFAAAPAAPVRLVAPGSAAVDAARVDAARVDPARVDPARVDPAASTDGLAAVDPASASSSSRGSGGSSSGSGGTASRQWSDASSRPSAASPGREPESRRGASLPTGGQSRAAGSHSPAVPRASGRHRVPEPGTGPGPRARGGAGPADDGTPRGSFLGRRLGRRRRFDAARARRAALAPATVLVPRPGRAVPDGGRGAGRARGGRGGRGVTDGRSGRTPELDARHGRQREAARVAIAGPVGVLTALAVVVVAAVLIGLAWAGQSDAPASAALGPGDSAAADAGSASAPPGARAATPADAAAGGAAAGGAATASAVDAGARSASAARSHDAGPETGQPTPVVSAAGPRQPVTGPLDASGDAATSGSDLRAALVGLDARRATAYAEGDAALLASLYAPGSPALRRDLDDLAALVAQQRHPVGFRSVVSSLRVLSRGADAARLAVVDRVPPFTLVDADGQVVAREPGRGERRFTVSLRRVGERWLYDEVSAG